MKISPTRFRLAFDRFQNIHEAKSGKPLISFEDPQSFTKDWEGYKTGIPERAKAAMQPRRWKKASIGSGAILESVVQAIELPGNNLLQWQGRQGPNSRVHRALLEESNDTESRKSLESLFHDLYARGKAEKATFEGLVAHCGRRYELLGYLFFIASPDRFLPLRTRSFDKALAELGVDLRTQGNCGWDNYLKFVEAIRQVQQGLKAEGIADATLLHAHSFCWILARIPPGGGDPLPQRAAMIKPFAGTMALANHDQEFSPRDEADARNMWEEARRRQASGEIAEEVALMAERDRLRLEGRSDLAVQVESVADRPGLGYDILSFDCDGTERFIEVKNVSNGTRFFLSDGEWRNSRVRSNYWFYLVSGIDSGNPLVSMVPALKLSQEHLTPMQYLVRFNPDPPPTQSVAPPPTQGAAR